LRAQPATNIWRHRLARRAGIHLERLHWNRTSALSLLASASLPLQTAACDACWSAWLARTRGENRGSNAWHLRGDSATVAFGRNGTGGLNDDMRWAGRDDWKPVLSLAKNDRA